MIVYVAGYPKSGTTWITRLLGDALNCPTGGSMPKEDSREIATEGLDRPREHIVRKGHFVLDDIPSSNPVTSPHRLSWKGLTDSKHRVVFVIRDPRDISVSSAFHWKIPVSSSLRNMSIGTNSFRFTGPWNSYISGWLEKIDRFDGQILYYEKMLQNGSSELLKLLRSLDFSFDQKYVEEAFERQSFENRVKDIQEKGQRYNLGQDFNLKFMRKGIIGDWRNHFDRATAFDSEVAFGQLLRYFNYEQNAEWWKEIL